MSWVDTTVGEYCPLVYGKSLPQHKRVKGETPVFGSNGCVDFHNESHVETHGLIIGRKGSVGEVHLSEVPFWPIDTSFYVTKDSLEELYFAYYLLKSLGLNKMNSDSAVPGLNRDNAHALKIKIPKLEEDRKKLGKWIAEFDKKIKLNNQINQTLEAMAQAIFKSWFVDFEPVKAKMAVLQAGGSQAEAELAAMMAISGKTAELLSTMRTTQPEAYQQLTQTAALFPAAMQESELGEIPMGWESASVYEISDVIYGAPFKSNLFNTQGNGLPLIRIRDLVDESPGVYTEETHPKGYLVQNGDLLVGMDGEFRPYIWGGNHAWMNQRICCFKPKNEINSFFIKHSITNQLNHLEKTATATTVIHLGKGDIDRFSYMKPLNIELIEKYSLIVNGLYNLIVVNKISVKSLTSLRDALLPKLLSGEFDLSARDEVAT